MKKIYFAAALALAATASMSAKELTFYLGNDKSTKIEPGKETTISCLEVLMEDESGVSGMLNPELHMEGDSDGLVTATAECVSGQDIQLCIGITCRAGQKVTINEPIEAGKLNNMLFEYSFIYPPLKREDIPVVTTNFTAAYDDDASSKVQFTLVMSAGGNGAVSVIGIDSDFRPVAGGIDYNFNGAANVAIYDLAGKKVLGASLSGSGVLSTSELPAGVYVYAVNGCVNKSGKIALK